MYLISGANIFGQWLSELKTINGFQKNTFTSKESNTNSGVLKCISWSYNILKADEDFYIVGAFKLCDNIFTKIKLPGKYKHKENDLILIGNDKYLLFFDNTNTKFWKLHLNDNLHWDWRRIPNFIETPENNDVKRMKANYTIIKAVTKNESCICLLSSGEVYEIPAKINTKHCDGVIFDVACGFDHTIALTNNGVVYTWGDGGRCQLGNGDLKNSEEPQAVEAILGIKIIKIAAGGWHNLALSDCGVLYTWGWNESGQLGVTGPNNANITSHAVPTVVDFYDENDSIVDINVKDIACGSRHSAILDSNNTVWTTGINNYGQLGFDSERTILLRRYRKVLSMKKDCSLFCGPWVTVVAL